MGVVYSNDRVFKTLNLSTPIIDTTEVGLISYTTATKVSQINSDGGSDLIEAGFVMSTSPDPTINDTKVNCNLVAPDYIIRLNLTKLQENQTYYIRSFARNALGITYSHNVKFITLAMTLGEIAGVSISNITPSSASLYSNVLSIGGDPATEVGFVYGDNPGPTILDNKVLSEPGWMVHYTGANKILTSLPDNHKYYVRSYIKNVKGIVYSPDNSFKTIQLSAPELDTTFVFNHTSNSMSVSSRILRDGGEVITEAGFVYSTTPGPTVNSTKIVTTAFPYGNGSGWYSMYAILNGLTTNQTYYIRSYAINVRGLSYGPELVKYFALDVPKP